MSSNFPVFTKLVKFIIPINNWPDKVAYEYMSGNSLDELEQNCIKYANDLKRKNSGEIDENKPVRFVILDAHGNPFIQWANNQWGELKDFIKDKATDKNDERGTPSDEAVNRAIESVSENSSNTQRDSLI